MQFESNVDGDIEGLEDVHLCKDPKEYTCEPSKKSSLTTPNVVRNRIALLIAIILVVAFRSSANNNDAISLASSRASSIKNKQINEEIKEINEEVDKDDFGLDVFVIGFAKTGTSSLLKFMKEDDELAMLPHENSDLFNGVKGLQKLEKEFDKIPVKEINEEVDKDDFGLDVFVIGFAKTGTSSLLKFMKEDDELAMLPHENSDLFNGVKGLQKLEKEFDKIPDSTNMKKGIKCPSAVRNIGAIRNLAKYTTKDTKLILGVRHPIKFFESFYNYRVKHLHAEHKSTSHIPRAEDLIGDQSHSWNKLYTEVARFEMFMKQLAKVDVSAEELKEMKKLGLKMVPNPYKIFLYNVDQLGDKNEERSSQFRSDLQEFLGLKESIPPLPEHNVNHESFPEYLDVCDDEHKEFRELMMSQGNETARWIRDEFMKSLDVVVGGKDFFLELLETWGSEICQTE
eukprot:CAMPEP_0195540934 /NCGR_PEP_ID=MMETSP0794_2-20130614/50824_1 /TAXON_ID=515487 /ORGANISM="Stephanopyxis turris, Strain CCMP 815" /LENGTH=454 /DNA_ID=CAMNT_0040675013 /DNA_START=453 /DNA_END=1817 /DNA_ORIENTATION=-